MHLLDFIHDAGTWSLEAVWMPVLIWTAVALPAFAAIRFARVVPPHVRYRASLALLYALPLGLLAGVVSSALLVEKIVYVPLVDLPETTFIGAAPSQTAITWSAAHTAGALLALAFLLAGWRLLRLASACVQLGRLRRAMRMPVPGIVLEMMDELSSLLGLRTHVAIILAEGEDSPMTFGWRRPIVMLPAKLADRPDDLRLSLLHELTHVRRRDYALQMIEQAVGAVFVIHPLVALLRHEVVVLREVTCDADVLGYRVDRSEYARLLYRFAESPSAAGLAVGIQLREKHLKTRLRSMKRLIDLRQMVRARRVGLLLAVTLLTLAITAIACSDLIVHPRSDRDETPVAAEPEIFVIVEQMPELVGGLAAIQGKLHYPESAKNEGAEGRVIIQFVVDEEGRVVEPTVVRGVHPDLDAAALAAVEKAVFKPGHQDGKPVKVRMSLPVTFSLGADAPPSAPEEGVPVTTSAISEGGPARVVDQMPELVGGLAGLMQDLKYPEIAAKAGIEGRVIVEFVVDKEGRVRDAHVVRGIGGGADEEALRVTRQARFEPGMDKGEPVEVKMSLPFTFKLPDAKTWTGDVVRIEVDSEGRYTLAGRPVEASQLTIPPAGIDAEKTMIVVRVDPNAPRDAVQRVQNAIRYWAKVISYETIR